MSTTARVAGLALLASTLGAALTGGGGGCLRSRAGAEQATEPGHEAAACGRRLFGLRFDDHLGLDRCGAGRHDPAHRRLLGFVAGLGELWQWRGFDRCQALVARLGVLADIGGTDTLDVQVRGLELVVGDDDQLDFLALLDLAELAALLVDQEVGYGGRCLDQHLPGVFLHRMFFDEAQCGQRQRLDAADAAMAVATRADDLGRFAERRTQTLARQFEQAETRNATDLHACAIDAHGVLELVLDLALVARAVHVDEVDDDQAACVADAQLAGDFRSGFQIGMERRFLDVATLGRLRRVDVDRGQRFGLVDNDRAACGQAHGALERIFDLRLDLEAREQRHRVLVQLELAQVVRHDLLDELAGVVVELLVVDEDLADVVAQVVAQGADDQFRFLVDQERGRARRGRLGNGFPQLQQVIEVPLQFLGIAAHAGGTDDQAHFIGQLQFIHGVLEALPVLAFDASRDAAGTRIVRHQHEVAAGQADEGGQGRALVAAFFLVDLDDDGLAFLDQLADAGLVRIDAWREVLPGDFLHRQEAVALSAVFDEAGFQRGFDPGDAAEIDVRLLLFAGGDLDVEIEQGLAIHDSHAQLFTLSCVDQHALHCSDSFAGSRTAAARERAARRLRAARSDWTGVPAAGAPDLVKLPTLSGRQRSFGACDSGDPLPPQRRQAISDSNRYDVRAFRTCIPLNLRSGTRARTDVTDECA